MTRLPQTNCFIHKSSIEGGIDYWCGGMMIIVSFQTVLVEDGDQKDRLVLVMTMITMFHRSCLPNHRESSHRNDDLHWVPESGVPIIDVMGKQTKMRTVGETLLTGTGHGREGNWNKFYITIQCIVEMRQGSDLVLYGRFKKRKRPMWTCSVSSNGVLLNDMTLFNPTRVPILLSTTSPLVSFLLVVIFYQPNYTISLSWEIQIRTSMIIHRRAEGHKWPI